MDDLLRRLENCIKLDQIDNRLIYRIKTNASGFAEHFQTGVYSVVEAYDGFVSEGDYIGAIKEMEKLLGLLEGLNDLNSETTSRETGADELVPKFQLEKEDKARVLELCTQMRKIVLATEVFDQPHKRRLLNRIAGIEHQVEQPKGLLDVVRSGVSDVGETLGKFGTDIKPLTDRMNEVASIARSSSKEYEQIPVPEELPQLPPPENSKAEE